MAKLKPPPRGKAASLVANERTSVPRVDPKPKPPPKTPPVHIPTAEKSVPMPDSLAGRTQITPPPARTRTLVQPPSLKPGPTKKHGESQRFFSPPAHRAGEPPDGYVAVRTTKGRGRAGIGAPVVSKPYWLATRQKNTGLEYAAAAINPADPSAGLATAEKVQLDAQGGVAGKIFRDTATSLVPKTFVDVGQGRPVHAPTVIRDIGNALLNFTPTPTPVIMGAVGVGARGSKVATTFVKSLSEGATLKDAAKAAGGSLKDLGKARRSVAIRAAERDVKPLLATDPARAKIHQQIDQQLPRAEAVKVKAELDAAAVDHAHSEAKAPGGSGSLRERRRQFAHDYYQQLLKHAGAVDHPAPAGVVDVAPIAAVDPAAAKVARPRTYDEAVARVDELAAQIDAVIAKVADRVGHPNLATTKDMQTEQLYRNRRNAKYDRQQSGKTRSGRASGASGYKIQHREKLVSQEVKDHAQRVIDAVAEKHPDDPFIQKYLQAQEERDFLQGAIDLHKEQSLGGEQLPVDYGTVTEPAPVEVPVAAADYRGQHTAPTPEGGAPMHDLANPDAGVFPTDVYSSDAARLYGHGGDAEQMGLDKATAAIIRSVRDNPQAEVTVYRAVPDDVAAINPGDWVTPNADYAAQHAAGEDGWHVIEQKVVAGDLYNDGNSIHEYGWHPSLAHEIQHVDPVVANPPPLDPGTHAAEVRDLADAADWQTQLFDPALLAAEAKQLHDARTLMAGNLRVQIPKARSRITNTVIERVVDRASKSLDQTVARDIPGFRLLTSTERAVKGAGRLQRQESNRRVARVARELKAISEIPEGSHDDVATFWYAQLPASHRNGHGLQLIYDEQGKELEYITSGRAKTEIDAHEVALRAEQRQAETGGEAMRLQQQIDELKILRQDLPFRVDDITASMGHLEGLIAKPPKVNTKALDAIRVLAEDRQRILVDGGRLKIDRATNRKGLLARSLGLEQDGTEIYIGHRLPKPESFKGSYAPSGGLGRVASPQGVGSSNHLVLARNGRLRASTRVAYEDWQSAQVFEQANISRDDLGAMGVEYKGGNVPEGHVLVNPKGQTIPPHWKTDELAQFTDDKIDRDEIRQKAREVLQGFYANDKAEQDALIELAYLNGQTIGDLRVVPKRLVDRYYSQFRSFRGRSTPGAIYDMAIDAVSTSIIFARVGYIPKNMVQNLVMSVPHQGAYFLVNAPRAAQVLADPYLRELLAGEVAQSSATMALSQERTIKKGFGRVTHFVTSIADEPARVTAFLHEAAAAGVIPTYKALLGPSDRDALVKLLTHKSQRPLLNDIRSRAVEAMGDFSRMTPDQARTARRFLVIPGWLMAGSRYPFHFAATHPVRTALMAYIGMGEPGAPEQLHFNNPVWTYFHGKKYLTGIDTRWGRLRTASLNPISTPWDVAKAIIGSIQGKTGPFDFNTPTAFDEVNPLLKSIVSSAQGDGVLRNLEALIPDYKFVRGMIDPQPSKSYPEDATWQGRLKREFGIIPIKVTDPGGGAGPMSTRTKNVPPTIGSGGGGGIFRQPGGIPPPAAKAPGTL